MTFFCLTEPERHRHPVPQGGRGRTASRSINGIRKEPCTSLIGIKREPTMSSTEPNRTETDHTEPTAATEVNQTGLTTLSPTAPQPAPPPTCVSVRCPTTISLSSSSPSSSTPASLQDAVSCLYYAAKHARCGIRSTPRSDLWFKLNQKYDLLKWSFSDKTDRNVQIECDLFWIIW